MHTSQHGAKSYMPRVRKSQLDIGTTLAAVGGVWRTQRQAVESVTAVGDAGARARDLVGLP